MPCNSTKYQALQVKHRFLEEFSKWADQMQSHIPSAKSVCIVIGIVYVYGLDGVGYRYHMGRRLGSKNMHMHETFLVSTALGPATHTKVTVYIGIGIHIGWVGKTKRGDTSRSIDAHWICEMSLRDVVS